MSTFFVDAVNGNDANPGTAANSAFLTLGAAVTACTAGGTVLPITVWVSPGIYREAVVLQKSGTDTASAVFWNGDIFGKQAWDSWTPGSVRVTKADADDVPQQGKVIDFNAKSYNYWYDFTFDGVKPLAAADTVVEGDSAIAGQEINRCNVVGGYFAASYMDINDSVVIGAYEGLYRCASAQGKIVKRCVVMGASESIQSTEICDSIIIGSGGQNSKGYNNLHIGGVYGLYPAFGGSDGNVFFCTQYGIRTATTELNGNLFAIGVRDTYAATESIGNSRSIYINAASNTVAAPVTAHCFELPYAPVMFENLARAFKFSKYRDFDFVGATTTSTATIDFEGAVRKNISASIQLPGPFAFPNDSISYSAALGNMYGVTQKGSQVIYLPLAKSTSISIGISCASNTDDASPYPQVALVFEPSSGVATLTETATSQAHNFAISVAAASVAYDQIGKLILKTFDETAVATAVFYNFSVT